MYCVVCIPVHFVDLMGVHVDVVYGVVYFYFVNWIEGHALAK